MKSLRGVVSASTLTATVCSRHVPQYTSLKNPKPTLSPRSTSNRVIAQFGRPRSGGRRSASIPVTMNWRSRTRSGAWSCAFCAALRACSVLCSLSGFAGVDWSAVDGKGECADGRLGETRGGDPSRWCVSLCCLSVAWISLSIRIWIESCQSRGTRRCWASNKPSKS